MNGFQRMHMREDGTMVLEFVLYPCDDGPRCWGQAIPLYGRNPQACLPQSARFGCVSREAYTSGCPNPCEAE